MLSSLHVGQDRYAGSRSPLGHAVGGGYARMGGAAAEKTTSIMLKEGETKFFIERVVR